MTRQRARCAWAGSVLSCAAAAMSTPRRKSAYLKYCASRASPRAYGALRRPQARRPISRAAETEALLEAAAQAVGARQRSEIADRIEKAVERASFLERELAESRRQSALGNVEELTASAIEVGGVAVAAAVAPVEDRDSLRQLMEAALKRLGGRSVVVLGAAVDGKPIFVAGVSKEAVEEGRLARRTSHQRSGADRAGRRRRTTRHGASGRTRPV